jgi:site-specific DNA-methyltransferase (adenine-specific)
VTVPINQIICGDNVETLRTLPDACVDLTVTSPPYDNLRTYGGHSWDFEGVASELWRVTKPGGVVVWVVNDATVDGSETGTSFRQALRFMEIGFRLHDTMIWNKRNSTMPEQNRYFQSYEYCFVFANGAPKSVNLLRDKHNIYAGKKHSSTIRNCDGTTSIGTSGVCAEFGVRFNVWDIDPCKSGIRSHPATFPEALARDHILSWSNEGDLVLDPFSGSGTTAKMAKLMGRQYLGIEINPEYCEIAAERLRQGVLF